MSVHNEEGLALNTVFCWVTFWFVGEDVLAHAILCQERREILRQENFQEKCSTFNGLTRSIQFLEYLQYFSESKIKIVHVKKDDFWKHWGTL